MSMDNKRCHPLTRPTMLCCHYRHKRGSYRSLYAVGTAQTNAETVGAMKVKTELVTHSPSATAIVQVMLCHLRVNLRMG